jgi:hypothetical protein
VRRARLLAAAALALAPLPLVAVLAWSADAGVARALPRVLVSAREGDLFVGEHRITDTTAVDGEPDWSPDRRYVVFVRQQPGERDSSLYVIRRDGGDLRRLTRGERVVAMPAWRGDGRQIAFASSPLAGGSFDIWVVGTEGGTPRPVAIGPTEQIAPAYGRSGKLTFRTLRPGEPFPEKRSDVDTPRTGPRELLPDFDQRAPFKLSIVGTKLGFSSATDNIGDGAVWIRGARGTTTAPMRARQLVRLADGTVRSYAEAGRLRYTPAPTHTHWHLLDFQRYELRTLEGTLIVRDRKTGFCLADHYGLARRRVASFSGARFLGNCAQFQPEVLSVEQGTSVGYTDLYPAHFHGQNLELKGISAGTYDLVHRANAQGRLEELDYTNNAASLRIRLTWRNGVPHVQTLRTCQDSATC